ncbi:MAG: polymer-forming cytoskeletal protein [Candidatus Tectomicrobia bacterium]|nr:polymer-forming cytoskeletal protein [Candidatus Tectomicrobia bacterium]
MAKGENVARRDDVKAFLGAGTEFKGVLSFQGVVRIDGYLEGEVLTQDTLVVGPGAELKAEISVGTLITEGHISGNVTAQDRIEIRGKSRLLGNIMTPVLFVEEGAIFEGSCKMTNTPPPLEPAPGGHLDIDEETGGEGGART